MRVDYLSKISSQFWEYSINAFMIVSLKVQELDAERAPTFPLNRTCSRCRHCRGSGPPARTGQSWRLSRKFFSPGWECPIRLRAGCGIGITTGARRLRARIGYLAGARRRRAADRRGTIAHLRFAEARLGFQRRLDAQEPEGARQEAIHPALSD